MGQNPGGESFPTFPSGGYANATDVLIQQELFSFSVSGRITKAGRFGWNMSALLLRIVSNIRCASHKRSLDLSPVHRLVPVCLCLELLYVSNLRSWLNPLLRPAVAGHTPPGPGLHRQSSVMTRPAAPRARQAAELGTARQLVAQLTETELTH